MSNEQHHIAGDPATEYGEDGTWVIRIPLDAVPSDGWAESFRAGLQLVLGSKISQFVSGGFGPIQSDRIVLINAWDDGSGSLQRLMKAVRNAIRLANGDESARADLKAIGMQEATAQPTRTSAHRLREEAAASELADALKELHSST